MLGRLTIAMVFLAVFGSNSWGQSEQRSQAPETQRPEAVSTQAGSQEGSRGTQQNPFVVRVLPTPKTDEDRSVEAEERERVAEVDRKKEKSDIDLITYTQQLAFFTKGLFIATVILAIATVGLGLAAIFQSIDTKRSIGATERAADAALRQANAMVAVESPILAIMQLKLVGYENEKSSVATMDPVPPGLPPPFCKIHIALQNRGRTEMIVNRVFCDWVVAPTVDEKPTYHFEEVWNGALPNKSDGWFASQNGIRLNQLEAETIDNFGQFLWVYGKVIYTDFMGEQFEHGYIARWTTGHGFVRDPLANYEYKRRI
jgi:hypothetical protein